MAQVQLTEAPGVLGTAFAAGDPAYAAKAQERENVAALTYLIHAIAEGRFGDLPERFTPDVSFEMVSPAGFPWVCHARGPEEVASAIAANFRSVEDQRPEVLALVAQGDSVMVMARETGRLKDSGEPYRVLLAQQYTFQDGRLSAFRSVAGHFDDLSV